VLAAVRSAGYADAELSATPFRSGSLNARFAPRLRTPAALASTPTSG
jgi:hypothetical protein